MPLARAASHRGGPTAADVAEKPATTSERDTSATRPYHQFLFQVPKEREWTRDKLQYKRLIGTVDIDAKRQEFLDRKPDLGHELG